MNKMTEIEKAVIQLINAGDETIDCIHCQGDYNCTEHKDKFLSEYQTLRKLVREKQGSISFEYTLRI